MSEQSGLVEGIYRAPLRVRLLGLLHGYFDRLQKIPRNEWPDDAKIATDLLAEMQEHIRCVNRGAAKGDARERMMDVLRPSLIVEALLRTHKFVNIRFAGDDTDNRNSVLAVYVDHGDLFGTYTDNDIYIRNLIF